MALPWTNKIIALEAENTALKALIEGTGLYVVAKADDGTFSLAPTEKATELLALGDVSAELADANANLSTLTDSNVALQRENDGYKVAFPANGHFAFTDGKVSLTDAGKAKLINAEVTRVLASTGHAPLPIGGAVDTPAGASGPDAKSSPKKRLAASFNAEIAARSK